MTATLSHAALYAESAAVSFRLMVLDALRLNVAARKVGGIRFFKLGRINVSFSVSARFRPFPE